MKKRPPTQSADLTVLAEVKLGDLAREAIRLALRNVHDPAAFIYREISCFQELCADFASQKSAILQADSSSARFLALKIRSAADRVSHILAVAEESRRGPSQD